MDQDGLFLMLKMCNICSTNKASWKKCMTRRHNPRMSTVSKEKLTFTHRQCVKPDQAMTIYKLRDHETNQDFLEFDEDIVFQTSCPSCLNIKSCLLAGHQLEDWQPRSAEVRDVHASGGSASQPTSPAPSPSSQSTGTGSGKRSNKGPPLLKGVAADGSDGGALTTTTPTARGRGKYARAEAGEKSGAGGAPGSAGDEKVTAAGARRRGDSEAQHAKPTAKSSHKRKSPGPATTPPAKNSKTTSPRSSIGSSQGLKSATSRDKLAGKRGAKDRHSAPGGGILSGRRKSRDAGVTPKVEVDGDNSETPMGEGEGGDGKSIAASNGGVDTSVSRKNIPATVAEKLELVKSEEAALLREFEDTHKIFAQGEDAKREEMAAFQRAGEAALHAMREKKEESLRRICEERMHKAEDRVKLVQQRLKEFEAAEAASRAEALERDATLEAEKKLLARGACSTSGKGTSGAWEDGSWTICASGDNNGAAAANPVSRAPEAAAAADSRDAPCAGGSKPTEGSCGQHENEPISRSPAGSTSLKREASPAEPSAAPVAAPAAVPAGEALPSRSSTSLVLAKAGSGEEEKEEEGKDAAGDKEGDALTSDPAATPTGCAGDGSLNPGGVSTATAVGNSEKTTPAGRVNGVVPAVGRPNSGSSVAAR